MYDVFVANATDDATAVAADVTVIVDVAVSDVDITSRNTAEPIVVVLSAEVASVDAEDTEDIVV